MIRLFILILSIFLTSNSWSLDVDSTIKSTIENNAKVKIGFEKLTENKELIEKALGSKLPTITGTISGTYAKSELDSKTSKTTPETFTDLYKITITQNLYDAGFNDLEIERSKILYNNEVINFQITIQDLVLDAITGYLTVLNYEKTLESTKKNFEFVSKALEETKTKYDLGSSTLYELQNAESLFAIAKANLFSAEQNYIISKKTFKRISSLEALNLEEMIIIDQNITFNKSLDLAMNNNLNLSIIKNNIKNNEILLLKEKKTKMPSLDLSTSAEYSDGGRIDDGTETTKGSISLTLTIPLYQQSIDDSNIRKYHSKILQEELNYEDLKADLQIQISNSFKDYNISEVRMKSNVAVIKASETAIKSLKEEYSLGTKTITDIIEEESNLLQARVNYFNSKKDFLVNYFKVKSLEGTLLNDFKNYLPPIN
ncbi:MAG: Outer membrane protein TolC [Alphaproteobacteria bacterium MarineAlpha5_Bin7]|nr:MAG: Outer membrane protein TolC [Alphaproteobacteria bacterium MarineAlpha5_Bin7]|tara:strand:- start:351 stop:1637 length:1287 start_codon:yes stop_codon:yes gene_type:complete